MDTPKPNDCPSPDRLRGLLSGELAVGDQEALTQHIEACPSCQRTLDGWLSSPSVEGLAAAGKDSPTQEAALRDMMADAKKKSAAAETQADLDAANGGDLAYLQPSEKPGHLGRLGHYEILQMIGKGGFGSVFKAFDEKLHRVVAIKVLAPVLASSGTACKRFTREARAAAAVSHDHVVTIHAVEDDHNPPYLVMQFVDGVSLQDKLDKHGPLGLKETLRIGLQTAEGLAAACKQGLVHRDIKPANILLENGVERVKITDFGLARAVDDASITQSGVIAGTPMYMSPEQAEGLPIDHRSDLFSLGTVLYVMCTGRPPFRASGTMAILKRVCEETPRPIHEINPEVPDWLVNVIAKLHAKDRKDRYQTAREVADVLSQHLAMLQQPASASGGRQPPDSGSARESGGLRPPLAKKKRAAAMLAALSLLVLAGIGIYWLNRTPVIPLGLKNEQTEPDKDGWVQLFNGKDLTGWTRTQTNWKVNDGVLVGDAPAYLANYRQFQDFHCRLEAKVNANGMGYFIFRHGDRWMTGVNISTTHSAGMGALIRTKVGQTETLAKSPRDLVTADTWMTLEVIVRGKKTEIKVNGIVTVDMTVDSLPDRGSFMLGSNEPGTVLEVRKIEIKELPPISTDPFVILAKDTRAETHHATLAAAVAWAQSGDTIEIHGDGPFVTGPINLQKKALAIRARDGFRPYLKFQPTGPKANEGLLFTEAPLVLEGLTLERAAHPQAEDHLVGTFILRSNYAPLHVANCRLIGTKIGHAAAFWATPAGTLRNSEILGDPFIGVTHGPISSSLLSLDNNLIVSKVHGFWYDQRSVDATKAVMKMHHNTVLSNLPLNFIVTPSLESVEKGKAEAPGVQLDAQENVLDNHGTSQVYFGPVHKSLTLEKAGALLPKLLSFQDANNLYAHRGKFFLGVNREGAPESVRKFETLAEWHKFWGIARSTSQVGIPIYQGGDVHAKSLSAPTKLTPADFRLTKGSPGKGVLPGGEDLGADVDLVGPGEAYERWKKTPAYQEWRKQAEELMAKAAATRSAAEPFVILAKDKRTETRYATLVAAIAWAQSGDTIEIQGNGPFVIDKTIETGTRALTIRAGTGFTPVLDRSIPEAVYPSPVFLAGSVLVLEGLSFRLAHQNIPRHLAAVVPTTEAGVLLANCHASSTGACTLVQDAKGVTEIRNCRTHFPNVYAAIGYAVGPKSKRLVIDNCILQGPYVPLYVNYGGPRFGYEPEGGLRLEITRSTILPTNIGVLFRYFELPRPQAGKTARTDLVIQESIFKLRKLIVLQSDAARPFDADEVEQIHKEHLRVADRRNLFQTEQFWGNQFREEKTQKLNEGPDVSKVATLAEWNALWNLKDTGTEIGEPRFVGGDLYGKLQADPHRLEAADFRLAKGSPGQGVLPGGKDLGADVDLVGPGAAYERWKKTPAYQEWRKQAEELMAKAAATQSAAEPFVILAKDSRPATHHATLAAAVVWAQSGDTIEIRGDGPFATGPIDLQKKALAIRAGAGFRPHLKYQPTDPKAKEPLLKTEAPLVLEGLTLERAAHPNAEDYLLWTYILYAYKAPLHVANCRLIGTKIERAAYWNQTPGGILRNTEILGDTAIGVMFNLVSSSRLSLENNLVAARRHGMWFSQYSPDLAKAVMTARHNTMLRGISLTFGFHPSLDFVEGFDPKAPGLRLDAVGNVLDSTPFYFNPVHESLPMEKAAPLLPKLLSVQDDYNLYVRSKGTHFLSVNRVGAPKSLHRFETLAEWHQFWGIAKSTSQVGTPVYQGGDVLAKALIAPGRLTPADFRLAPGSPGQGAGPGGKDLGADVDLVGPGEAYEKWQKTPAYQEWRKQTDDLMAKAATAAQPFVVLAKANRAETRHPTLAAAVDAAQSGDTIEIRGNGPFETMPIDIRKRALTIRAGQGWRPIVSLHQDALANAAFSTFAEETLSLLRTEAALLLEGLQLQVLDPKLGKKGQQRPAVVCIHSFGGSLHLANCSIVMSRKGPALPNLRAIRTYNPAHVSAKNCTFQGEMGHMIALDLFARADGRFEALLDNCTLVGHGGVSIYAARSRRLGSLDLVIRQSTFWANNFMVLGSLPSDLEGENMIRVTTRQNVLAGNLWYNQRTPGRPVSEELLYLKRLMKWQEEKTLWLNRPEQGLSLSIVDEKYKPLPDQPKIGSLVDWNRIWGLADTGSILGIPRFVKEDLLSKAPDSAPSLTPADFRLAKGSPGQGTGPDGKDLGADVDLVGPGPAYEKWLKTPAYQEWRKQTDDLMTKAITAALPFVVLSKGQPDLRHATLAAAVTAAKSGDTIEIRGDGPFDADPIIVQAKNLYIRAGAGSRPVLRRAPAFRDKAGNILTSSGTLILEGLELQNDTVNTSGHLLGAGGPLLVSHCRFVCPGFGHAVNAHLATRIEIRNSEVLTKLSSAVVWSVPSRGALAIDKSVIAGGSGLAFNLFGQPLEKVSLQLTSSTITGNTALIASAFIKGTDVPNNQHAPAAFVIDATGNVIQGKQFVVSGRFSEPSAESVQTIEKFFAAWKWNGGMNLFGPTHVLQVQGKPFPEGKPVRFPTDWQTFWKSDAIPGTFARAEFQGGDVLVQSADFRLAADSPGKGAGPGGKDLGADVSLVGPGPAYENWLKTPAYQEWRKQVDALIDR